MLRSLYPIQVTQNKSKILITRLLYKSFMNHLNILYGVDSDKQIPLFGLVEPYFFQKLYNFSFDEFFAPEIYYIFKTLYEKFKNNDYANVCNLLTTQTWLRSIFQSKIKLPSNINDSLTQMKSTLLRHQKEYIQRYFESKIKLQLRGSILAFDQGLGKTVTALAVSLVINKPQTVIICPLSLSNNWKYEILNHIDSNASIAIVGQGSVIKAKYIICSYERIFKLEEYINNQFMIIIDECHNIRYLDTQRTQNIIALQHKYKVSDILALSGTPIKALASELIPILILLDPKFNVPSTIATFNSIYNKFREFAYHILQYRLSIMMERKLKNEVLSLPTKHPPKILVYPVQNYQQYTLKSIKEEVIKYAQLRMNELMKDVDTQFKYFYSILNYCIQEKILTKQEAKFMYNVIVKLTTGRSTTIFTVGDNTVAALNKFNELYDKCRNELKTRNNAMYKALHIIRASTLNMTMKAFGEAIGKIYIPMYQKALVDLFQSNFKRIMDIINNSQKKTILFSMSVVALKQIYNILSKNNVPSILITGDVGGNVTTEIDRFKQDPYIPLLLASIQKLSTGVTITEANTCIFLGTPYRDADFQQAQDRIHRIGQDTEVFIYILTIDTKGEPNIVEHHKEIMDWSAELTGTLIRK